MVIAIAILSAVVTLLAVFAWRCFADARSLRTRYGHIADVDAEIARARERFKAEAGVASAGLESSRKAQAEIEAVNEKRKAELSKEYETALARYGDLKKQLALAEDNAEDISFGLYEPHFAFGTSEEYRDALQKVRDDERALIRDKSATSCPINWTVGNSERDGERMVRQYSKLLLRAFNGESDAAVANVSWDNITR